MNSNEIIAPKNKNVPRYTAGAPTPVKVTITNLRSDKDKNKMIVLFNEQSKEEYYT